MQYFCMGGDAPVRRFVNRCNSSFAASEWTEIRSLFDFPFSSDGERTVLLLSSSALSQYLVLPWSGFREHARNCTAVLMASRGEADEIQRSAAYVDGWIFDDLDEVALPAALRLVCECHTVF